MQKSVNRRRLKILLAALLTLVLLWIMLRWFEHHQVYYPSKRMDFTPAAFRWKFSDVDLKTADGVRLHGWFLPAEPESANRQRVVLHLHGNAGNISHRLHDYEIFRQAGLNILALDYRGYGRSEGRPSEGGTYLDAEAAQAWLVKAGFLPKNIIVWGESLGGGVATELALRQKVGALALQSTFTSIPDVGAELFPWLPVRWISTIRYDTRSKLPGIQVPVAVLHSRADTLIAFHHGEENFAAAGRAKVFCELLGNHNDTLSTPAGQTKFREGLEKVLALMPPPAR